SGRGGGLRLPSAMSKGAGDLPADRSARSIPGVGPYCSLPFPGLKSADQEPHMCDSFVALPSATTTKTTLAAKNADCEINEAQAVLHVPRCRYPEGAMLRATHIVIPQLRHTPEATL